MYACFLDVLHDCPDKHIFLIADRIHIDFACCFKEVVDKDGVFGRNPDCLFHVAFKVN